MTIDLLRGPLKKAGITHQQVLPPLCPQGFSSAQQGQKKLVQSFLETATMGQGCVIRVFSHSGAAGGLIQ